MPTTLPARPTPSLPWGRAARLAWLLWRADRLARRMAAAHHRVDRLGIDAAGDRLLAAAHAWVACHAEIGALLDRPEPPEVAQVRAAGRIGAMLGPGRTDAARTPRRT